MMLESLCIAAMLTSIVSVVASLWCVMHLKSFEVIKHTPPPKPLEIVQKPLEIVHEVLPEVIFVNPHGDTFHNTSQCSSVTMRSESYTLCKNCKVAHNKKKR